MCALGFAGDLDGPGILIPQIPGQNKVGEVSGSNEEETGPVLITDRSWAAGCVVSVYLVSLEDG